MPTNIRPTSPNKEIILAGIYTLFLIGISLYPLEHLPPAPGGTDKLVHLLLYFAAFRLWIKPFPSKTLYVALALSLLGIVLEILQGWLPLNRHADILDALANVSGILLAYFLRRIWH